jgi:hypothetical protein
MRLARRHDPYLSCQEVKSSSEMETRALMRLARRHDPYLSCQEVKSSSEMETRALIGLARRYDPYLSCPGGGVNLRAGDQSSHWTGT